MLNPLQEKLLEMLGWFHDYCEKHEIRYFVCGGTLLGAVRHKGFIPWDDDVDVLLPRPDYEKLIAVFGEQEDKYRLETPYSKNKDYLYSFAKIYDTTTTLIEHTKCNCKRGVYLDIFPLDGIGNSEAESRKIFAKANRLNMFLMTRTCGIRKGRSFYKNAAVVLSRMIPNFIIDDKKLAQRYDRLCAKHAYEDSKYVGCLMGAYGEKETFKKDIFSTVFKLPFENITVNGIGDYDTYLRQLYGDWKQLPPPEKRFSHHDFISLDLERSYLDENESVKE